MKIAEKTIFIPILIAFFFAGCAAPQVKHTKERIFYPNLPDRPRIEYIGAYDSQHSFPKTRGQRLKESILGKEPSFIFGRPIDVASCGDGKVYISDSLQDRVIVYNFNENTVSHLTAAGTFQNPTGLATDGDCNLYVVNTKKNRIYVYDRNGKPYFSFGGPEVFEWPSSIAVDDANGHIYISDVRKHDVLVFDKSGKFLFSMLEKADRDNPDDGGFNFPLAIDVASDGRVLVLDTMNARVKVYSPSGEFLMAWGERGDSPAAFGLPKGLAIDNDDNVYVTDADSSTVKVFSLDGTVLTAFGGNFRPGKGGGAAAAGFYLISGIDVDPKDGIFIADQLNKNFQVFQYLDDEYLKKHPLPVYSPEETKKGAGWDSKQ